MFHVDLPVDTQVTSKLSPIITVRLLFIHKTIGCVHQTRPRMETRHSATCFANTYRSPYLLWCQAALMEWNESFLFTRHELSAGASGGAGGPGPLNKICPPP